ncbi:MAG TPA: thiamine pyrophosphate-binding protein [Candidatus Acidoferrales bacterium]|jgi:acetolactate synthase-1/2/3 large subunit|nr:thiamine pyrophosphate-binding protein [Candidatus Acidoferrales bacterium]
MRKPKKDAMDRRKFLKGAAAGAAALAGIPAVRNAQQAEVSRAGTAQPMPKQLEAETPAALDVLTENRSGSDFMVDVIKSLGIEYVASNPGSSFRGLHESVINYGGNENPEFITCCHEESAVAMAHGYSKIEGKPMAVFLHSDVGLQHGSMAIYNAFCDRVPIFLVAGNALEINSRRPGVEWDHSVQDAAAIVRDCLKWDDVPISLDHFAESAIRAYKITMTPPMAPVLLIADGELQEGAIADDAPFHIPKLTHAMPPQGDSGSVTEAARMLVAAENPVILLERTTRTADGLKYTVELAETLQAPVVDLAARMNFPSQHPLNQTERTRAVIGGADVILGLEALNFWGTINSYRDQLHRTSAPITKKEVKLISISAGDLYLKSNYQDFQRYTEVDLAMAADAEATLPSLIEAVKRLLTDDRKRMFADRGKKLAAQHEEALRRSRDEAAYGWDASPITTARLCAEIWGAIKDDDWTLACEVSPWVNRWPLRLWNFDKFHQYIGSSGGFGVGYGAPAALGAALANKKHGRLTVTIQNDGDLMYAPGVLWTSAHHQIPLLSVMHNNRAYHQEVMHVQRMCDRRSRGIDRASIGTTLTDPNINFAMVSKGMGVYSEGPITDPKDLGPAILRAKQVVKRGEPALVEAVTQPR